MSEALNQKSLPIDGVVAINATPRLIRRQNLAYATATLWLVFAASSPPISTPFIALAALIYIIGYRLNTPIKASPLLVLNEEGLAWYAVPNTLIRWEDIEHFTLKRKTIHLRLKDRAYWIYPFGKSGLNIKTDRLDLEADELFTHLNARMQAYAPIEAGPELYE